MLFNKKNNDTKVEKTNEIKEEKVEKEKVAVQPNSKSKPQVQEKEKNKEQANVPVYSKYENVDMSRFSREKMFQIIVELILENKMLAQSSAKLSNEILVSNDEIKGARQKSSDVSGKIDYIAQRVAPKLMEMINNGQTFTLDAKVSIIVESVQNEKRKYIEEIMRQKEDLKNYKIVLDELKAQLIEKTENENKEALSQNKEFTDSDFETFAGSSAVNRQGEVSSIQGSIAIKAIDLEKSRASIDETGKKIIEGIGKEGISEHPALLQYCLKSNCGITESKFETACENLKLNSVIDVDIVQSFNRIRGVRVFSLTNEVGKLLYKEFFREKPVLSEKEKLKRENDNLSHGYSIKDVYNVLEELGYTEISMDRKTNTIPISGANTYVPDIIATNPISGRKEYIEVEMGTHNKENFNFKLDKANLKATVLKIVVPNKSVAENVCRKVEDWRALNLKKASAITIFVQRFSELKTKDDGRVFAPTDKIKAADLIDKKNGAKNNQSPKTKTTSGDLEDDV